MLPKIIGVIIGVAGLVTAAVENPKLPVTPRVKSHATVTAPIQTVKATTTPAANAKPKAAGRGTILLESPQQTPAAKVVSSENAPSALREKRMPVRLVDLSPATTTMVSSDIPEPPRDFGEVNQIARRALVNILCTSKSGKGLNPLSGSGVIVDNRGIILTNAHVAQYMLLEDYSAKDFLTCIGRTGSPATPAYTLKLLYISSAWLRENYKQILAERPTGTGEHDFALLQITGTADERRPLSGVFPALVTDDTETPLGSGAPVVLTGYPAGFLGDLDIETNLHVVSSVGSVGERFTFARSTLDAFSLGGNLLAQQGSSGGAVVSPEGKVLGILVTATDAPTTAERELNAISMGHINRTLYAEARHTLPTFLHSNLTNFSTQFDTMVIPALKTLLYEELNAKREVK